MSQWTQPALPLTSDTDTVQLCFSPKISKIFPIPLPLEISSIWEGTLRFNDRFAFEVYDESFQARNNPSSYCSWALLHGDVQNKDFSEYQLSRAELNLSEEKYSSMKETVRELREYARGYLEKNSVLTSVPAGVNPKDQDFVVQVVRKNEQGVLRVRDGKREVIVRNCPTFVEEKEIGKLRSVAKVRKNEDGENEVVNNNFTSLIKLPEWTADAQTFLQKENAMEVEEETEMFTDLSYLNSAPLGIFF